jgi:hypothetical protein
MERQWYWKLSKYPETKLNRVLCGFKKQLLTQRSRRFNSYAPNQMRMILLKHSICYLSSIWRLSTLHRETSGSSWLTALVTS